MKSVKIGHRVIPIAYNGDMPEECMGRCGGVNGFTIEINPGIKKAT